MALLEFEQSHHARCRTLRPRGARHDNVKAKRSQNDAFTFSDPCSLSKRQKAPRKACAQETPNDEGRPDMKEVVAHLVHMPK